MAMMSRRSRGMPPPGSPSAAPMPGAYWSDCRRGFAALAPPALARGPRLACFLAESVQKGANLDVCAQPARPALARWGLLPPRTPPVRMRRVDVSARLSTRDLEALRWVGEQYACRLDHLQVLLGRLGGREALSASAARSVVTRWETLGMAARGSFIAGEPSWVWLTRRGLRQAGLAFRVVEPKPWTLPHTAAVNRVRLFVEPRRPGARWRPERELRAAGDGAGQTGPVPDAEIHDV